jgi:pimeloyl-ACP methyl ester carboxylesterase
LPGFGGTADLPVAERTIAGYAAWLDDFLDTMDVNEPSLVIGHSFGGGVATLLAHDFPSRVSYLVLVNSVGGPSWASDPSAARLLADRPLWDWGMHLVRELFPPARGLGVINAMREDFVPNVLRNPRALWEVGDLARRADLSVEMADLRARGVPVLALWGDRDGVIPQASFDALCAAIGADGLVLAGHHSWLLTNPGAFDEVMANVLELAGELDDVAAFGDADRECAQGPR